MCQCHFVICVVCVNYLTLLSYAHFVNAYKHKWKNVLRFQVATPHGCCDDCQEFKEMFKTARASRLNLDLLLFNIMSQLPLSLYFSLKSSSFTQPAIIWELNHLRASFGHPYVRNRFAIGQLQQLQAITGTCQRNRNPRTNKRSMKFPGCTRITSIWWRWTGSLNNGSRSAFCSKHWGNPF